MVAHWDAQRNGGAAPASGRDSKQQAYFWLGCGQCSTKIQIKTAVKQGQQAFECPVHGSSGRGLSYCQRQALGVLEGLLGPGSCSVEQYRLLPAARKPIDIVVEGCGLLVEVDGPQHAASSSGWGEAAGVQCERDQQFERTVLACGARLLRLHWADEASWRRHVQAALRRCKEPGGFVYYSASYPEWRRVDKRPPSL